jgi:hypothetical protein
MFGMLDYRAYKLLWLICLPLRWLMWIAEWASIVIAIMIGTSLNYGVPVRIIIAYLIWEGLAILLLIIRAILFWFIKKGFFWLVDIVPAKAESVAEAKEMVLGGPLTWLVKKWSSNIQNFTEDDTEQLASLLNWRARFFFRSTERVRERVRRFQELYETTGKQPGDLTEKERLKLVADLEDSWLAKAIIHPLSFGAILRIVIISVAIVSLDNRSQVGWQELGGFALFAAMVISGFLQIREEREKKRREREEKKYQEQMEREEAEYRRDRTEPYFEPRRKAKPPYETQVLEGLTKDLREGQIMEGLKKRLIGPS